MESILTSIKKLLGIDSEYEHFDTDIVIHINSVFMALQQIGVGPDKGFIILGKDETWFDYIADDVLSESVKTYIYLKVRLLFDPPGNSFLIDAMTNQTKEIEWRLLVNAERGEDEWQNKD